MSKANLERYAFYWLLLLLLFSAAAMFLGARPLVMVIGGSSSSAMFSLLDLSWIVCGLAAIFLTYQWVQNGKKLFGGGEMPDGLAFWFMILAGYNLGITGLLGNNIFLSVVMGKYVLMLTGVLCLATTYRMYTRWQENGQQLFAKGKVIATSEAGEETEVLAMSGSEDEIDGDAFDEVNK